MSEILRHEVDVAVVGGGPAGSTAAAFCRREGLSVVLLEARTFPRDKICGDGIGNRCLPIFDEIGVGDAVRALPHGITHGIIFSSPKGDRIQIDYAPADQPPKDGYIIRRKLLDNVLFQHAKSMGALTREKFKVTDVLKEGDTVVGVRGQEFGQSAPEEYRARVVIGADGWNSAVAHGTGNFFKDDRHWSTAVRQYWSGVKGLTPNLELHYINDIIPGYFWIFPLENGNANVGLGIREDVRRARNIDLRALLRKAMNHPDFRDRFADAKPLEPQAGQWPLPLSSRRRQMYGNGFVLCGDAAALIDSFSGGGIAQAVPSGKIAALTIAEILKSGRTPTGDALRLYDERFWSAYGGELSLSYRMQRLASIKFLLNLVIGKASRSAELRETITRMMSGTADRQALASPAFYLKLLFA